VLKGGCGGSNRVQKECKKTQTKRQLLFAFLAFVRPSPSAPSKGKGNSQGMQTVVDCSFCAILLSVYVHKINHLSVLTVCYFPHRPLLIHVVCYFNETKSIAFASSGSRFCNSRACPFVHSLSSPATLFYTLHRPPPPPPPSCASPPSSSADTPPFCLPRHVLQHALVKVRGGPRVGRS